MTGCDYLPTHPSQEIYQLLNNKQEENELFKTDVDTQFINLNERYLLTSLPTDSEINLGQIKPKKPIMMSMLTQKYQDSEIGNRFLLTRLLKKQILSRLMIGIVLIRFSTRKIPANS